MINFISTILLLVALHSSTALSAPSTLTRTRKSPPALLLNQLGFSHDNEVLADHRHSASDWLYNVRSVPESTVLREVRNPVFVVAGWSLFVSLVQGFLSRSSFSPFQAFGCMMCIPGQAHGMLVGALSLLLSFRTKSAYQKFCEGRKTWGDILSVTRDLTRMIQLYTREVGSERKQLIGKLVAAYPDLLRYHIRSGVLCEKDKEAIQDEECRLQLDEPMCAPVETRHDGYKTCLTAMTDQRTCWVDRRNLPWSLFDEESLSRVARSANRPLWVCDRLGREIMNIPYTPNFTSLERMSLLVQVEKLTNAVGQCERIHRTAIPLNYARHSLRSLTLWVFTLPFTLVKDFGMLTSPVNACITLVLFGVYQIGYSLEDPFQGSLQLTSLCDAIRKDVFAELCVSNHRNSACVLNDWNDEEEWDREHEQLVQNDHLQPETLPPLIRAYSRRRLSTKQVEPG
jgi:putative membrane protein